MGLLRLCAALLLGLLLSAAARAGTTLTLGYLEQSDDARYLEERTAARYPLQPWGRPYAGAEVALKESRFAGSVAGVDFALERATGRDADALAAELERLAATGVHFFLVDAPGPTVAALAERTRGRDLLLFNLSALDDGLRQEQCQPQLLHVVPSRAMLTDALAQYLISKKWREILVLQGPSAEDADFGAALARSTKRFGLKVAANRPFILSRDPRQRDQNNVALLTGGEEYDVVVVADADGEFARDVPYQILRPRPVAGAAGLTPEGWHWAWERHGAPQLNKRFQRQAKRPMTMYDWAAWMAVKAVAEAVARTGSGEFAAVGAYLRGEEIVLDGFKGYRLSFRPWNGQLRQPVFLTTLNWVVARAPLPGFLNPQNNLDTLGFDARESRCKF